MLVRLKVLEELTRRHEFYNNTYPEEVINRAKFDVSTPKSFGRINTNRIALYSLDNGTT